MAADLARSRLQFASCAQHEWPAEPLIMLGLSMGGSPISLDCPTRLVGALRRLLAHIALAVEMSRTRSVLHLPAPRELSTA